jgi:hypothetical protein
LPNSVSCNFGDQLHPSGEMDMETYRIIGEALRIEKIEIWFGGVPASWSLGLLDNAADHGVVNILWKLTMILCYQMKKIWINWNCLIIPSANKFKFRTSQHNGAGKIKLIVFGKGIR